MENKSSLSRLKIGVLDSGIGGLTVVRELEKLLPNEEILYYGDNANCPYGNRSEENIVELTKHMIDFLQEKGVKLVAIACNTISTLIDHYQGDYPFAIFSIVEPAAAYVAKNQIKQVGVIATEFTVNSGCYTRLIQKASPDTAVYGEGSHNLAMLVDAGNFDGPEVEEDVSMHLDQLLSKHPVEQIVLGCTHYPIVQPVFERFAPSVEFINPAVEQALAVKEYLLKNSLQKDDATGSLEVFTSGSVDVYAKMLQRLGIQTAATFHHVPQ